MRKKPWTCGMAGVIFCLLVFVFSADVGNFWGGLGITLGLLGGLAVCLFMMYAMRRAADEWGEEDD